MPVLLVDDDPIPRLSLANIVRSLDGVAGIHEAVDGVEALELLRGGLRPALCCCDLHMPRLDGLGVLQAMRANAVWRHIPLVLITSESDRGTVQAAISGGVAGYILKPFLAAQTLATLQRVLKEQRALEAEPAVATRRRLGVDPATLQARLAGLRVAVEQARAAVAPERVAQDALRGLPRVAAQLGLWRASGLLREAADSEQPEDRADLLDEALRLVDQRASAPCPPPT